MSYNTGMSQKRLERDKESALVAGVLAGLAHYFKQDPVLFRLAGILFLLVTGIFPGLLIYIAAWILMPLKDKRADYIIK